MTILLWPKVIQRKTTKQLYAAWAHHINAIDRRFSSIVFIGVRPVKHVWGLIWRTTGPETTEAIDEFEMRSKP